MTASKSMFRCALVSLLLASSAAHAQPSAAQKETARGLMAEARELRERGDLAAALARFSAADSLMGVPTTGFEVAATQAQLGRLVEARETLRHVLAIAQSPDDPEPFNEARAKARALDQQLLSRIGTLRFAVNGLGEGEALAITVDGEVVPRALVGLPFRVNPGHHVIVAHARGREVKREVDAVEAQPSTVALTFARDAAPVESAPAPAPAPSEAEPAPSAPAAAPNAPVGHGLPTLAYAGGGVAVVGTLVGSVAGISAISHKNAAKQGCVAGGCPPSTWSDLDSARSMATVSTIGFVVGAIGLVVGAGAILLDERPSSTERALVVSPDVNAQGARLTIAGRF
jgi:hypothetical protein